jgi:short-chain fatty acids transporter
MPTPEAAVVRTAGFNPVNAISRGMTRFVSRYLPDPFIFAIFLTILVFGLAVALTPKTPLDLVQMWGAGFWNLLAFSMQMALVLVTGHALATAEPIRCSRARWPGGSPSRITGC